VDEPLGVGGVESAAHLGEDAEGAVDVQPALGPEQLAQVGAVDVAHGDEEHAVHLAGPEDGHDVEMVEGGGQARLADEALAELRVLGELGAQDLQGHPPGQVEVLGEVDEADAAPTEERLDAIAGELRADPRGTRHGLQLYAGPARSQPCASTRA
jgi:hypothetical protein